MEDWTKYVKGVKKYKLPIIKYISQGGVTYNMVPIVDNTVLYI